MPRPTLRLTSVLAVDYITLGTPDHAAQSAGLRHPPSGLLRLALSPLLDALLCSRLLHAATGPRAGRKDRHQPPQGSCQRRHAAPVEPAARAQPPANVCGERGVVSTLPASRVRASLCGCVLLECWRRCAREPRLGFCPFLVFSRACLSCLSEVSLRRGARVVSCIPCWRLQTVSAVCRGSWQESEARQRETQANNDYPEDIPFAVLSNEVATVEGRPFIHFPLPLFLVHLVTICRAFSKGRVCTGSCVLTATLCTHSTLTRFAFVPGFPRCALLARLEPPPPNTRPWCSLPLLRSRMENQSMRCAACSRILKRLARGYHPSKRRAYRL